MNPESHSSSQWNMPMLVSNWSGFVSVVDPYSRDRFTSQVYNQVSIHGDHLKQLTDRFHKALQRSNLFRVLKAMQSAGHDKDGFLNIVDGGVYMGIFSISCHYLLRDIGLLPSIRAYEMSPILKHSILKNFAIHSCPAQLNMFGIGRINSTHSSLYFTDDGMIGASVVPKTHSASQEVLKINAPMLSLSSIITELENCTQLIKLDLEGHEPDAFRSLLEDSALLEHVFIVEYSPWQGTQKMKDEQTYSEFLTSNFVVFNVDNWISSKKPSPLKTVDDLLLSGQSGSKIWNTDLLLIPHSFSKLLDAFNDGLDLLPAQE